MVEVSSVLIMLPKSRRFKKGSSYQTVFFSIFLCLLLLAVITFLIYSNWKITQKRAELTSKVETLKKEIQILEEKNANLRAGKSQTETEDYWKGRLYEQGYVEKGEQQVVVLPPKEEETKKEEKGFWNPQDWWDWLREKLRE